MAYVDIAERRQGPGPGAVMHGAGIMKDAGLGYFDQMLKVFNTTAANPMITEASNKTALLGELVRDAAARGYGSYPTAYNPKTGQMQQAAGPPTAAVPQGYYLGENAPELALSRIWEQVNAMRQNLPFFGTIPGLQGWYPRLGRGFMGFPGIEIVADEDN